MTTTTFSAGTVVASSWLNDVNTYVYKNTWNILNDGVDNTGLVDATSLINARIVTLNAAGGGTIVFPTGTYLVKDITLLSNVNLVAGGKVTLVKNGGTDETHLFTGTGTIGTGSLLTANATANAWSCTVTSAAGFTANTYVLLRDNTYISGAAGRNQEILYITNIASTTITFNRPLTHTYTTANAATLLPLSPLENVVIGGFTGTIAAVGGGNVGGHVDLNYAVNCVVTQNTFSGSGGDAAIRFKTCYLSSVTNNLLMNGQNMSAAGFGYGIEFDEATHYCTVTGNKTVNVRENTFTNRTNYCLFAHNVVLGSYDTSFNTHGAGVHNCVIQDNVLVGTQTGYGISVGFGTHTAGDYSCDFIDNKIANTASHGISINAPSGLPNSNIRVKGNTIENPGVSTGSSVGVTMTYTNSSEIKDNTIVGTNTNVLSGITISNSTSPLVENNIIQDIPNGYGITYTTLTSGTIRNNFFTGVSSYNVRGTGTSTGVKVINNEADDTLTQMPATGYTSKGNSWSLAYGSTTYDPPSLADGAGATTTVTVTGAALGDYASAAFSVALTGVTVTAWVSAANTVSVRFQNESGGVVDLASGTLTAYIEKVVNV